MNSTSTFLSKYVAVALEQYPQLLPYLFVFHASVGWGDKMHTVVPLLLRVTDRKRPPMIWLLGPLPLSPLSCKSVVDWIMYFFDLGYSVRWTSNCSYCDTEICDASVHRCVFSILACRDDANVHCSTPISFEQIPTLQDHNKQHSIPQVALFHEGKPANRMQKSAISTLQMRDIFQTLLGGPRLTQETLNMPNVQEASVYERFFRPTSFLNVMYNDPSSFLCGDGYGINGIFSVVQIKNVCRLNHDVVKLPWSEEFTWWMNSFMEENQSQKRAVVSNDDVLMNKKMKI